MPGLRGGPLRRRPLLRSCGFDFENPAPVGTSWEAVATADRAQFERLAVDGVTFPDGYGERRFPLRAGENRIGRSRGQPGEEAPEIDLAAPPLDPGISRLHAVLEHRADGTCVLRDLGVDQRNHRERRAGADRTP